MFHLHWLLTQCELELTYNCIETCISVGYSMKIAVILKLTEWAQILQKRAPIYRRIS